MSTRPGRVTYIKHFIGRTVIIIHYAAVVRGIKSALIVNLLCYNINYNTTLWTCDI